MEHDRSPLKNVFVLNGFNSISLFVKETLLMNISCNKTHGKCGIKLA